MERAELEWSTYQAQRKGTWMKTKDNPEVTVIIPALNEEKGIGPTILELQQTLGDLLILVIDGNSTDRTVEIASGMKAGVVMQGGKGKGQAIAQALKYVDSNTRYVVFIDADFTYPAGIIPRMIEILRENPDVGMVNGNRFEPRFTLERGISNPYYIGNRFLAFLQYMFNGVNLRDPLTGLRVVRWEILRGWKPKSKGFDIEAELNHLVERKGYRIKEVPIQYRRRLGEKKLKLIDGFSILKRIVINSW